MARGHRGCRLDDDDDTVVPVVRVVHVVVVSHPRRSRSGVGPMVSMIRAPYRAPLCVCWSVKVCFRCRVVCWRSNPTCGRGVPVVVDVHTKENTRDRNQKFCMYMYV